MAVPVLPFGSVVHREEQLTAGFFCYDGTLRALIYKGCWQQVVAQNFNNIFFDWRGLIHERIAAFLDRRREVASLFVGATVIELEVFGGRLMASLLELWLKRLVVGGAAPEQ
ncbi:hypothetical protein C4D60_Mb06t21360 [Musa balbisiana]|uniref:Uncharacterized protein n=1 Tax=Musa balbisiana TaxID=52838 RepID=A0A4S8IQX6_MUSBA|nr:hypothetical protein C4D60_Mb06t21360 [Musa balbisiana]